jgi:hypothetical protein
MSVSREKMMSILKAKYPKLFIKESEEFGDGHEGAIWSSGEDGTKAKDGWDLFDYYGEGARYGEAIGVHKEAYDLLEKNGWYAEWYDAGTIFFYKDN